MKLRFKVDTRYTNLTEVTAPQMLFPKMSMKLDVDGTEIISDASIILDVMLAVAMIKPPDGDKNFLIAAPVYGTKYTIRDFYLDVATYVYTLDIDIPEVFQSSDIYFKHTHTNPLDATDLTVFEQTVKVYGYDLGNNSNESITTNQDFDFNIIIPDPNNPAGNHPYASFVAITNPVTNSTTLYTTNNSLANTSYYDGDDNLIVTGDNGAVCSTNGFVVYQSLDRVVPNSDEVPNSPVGGNCGCGSQPETIWETVVSSELTITAYRFLPTFEITSSCYNETDDICSIVNNALTVTPSIGFNGVSMFTCDDTDKFPFSRVRLEYKAYNSIGSVVDSQTDDIILTYPAVIDPVTYSFDFTPSAVGRYAIQCYFYIYGIEGDTLYCKDLLSTTYNTLVDDGSIPTATHVMIVKTNTKVEGDVDFGFPVPAQDYRYSLIFNTAELISGVDWGTYTPGVGAECGLLLVTPLSQCFDTIELDTRAEFDVVEQSCGVYRLYNNTSEEISVNVNAVSDSTHAFALVETLDITAQSYVDYTLPETNVYQFVYNDGVNDTIWVKANYCQIEDCFMDYIKALICCDPTVSCKVPNYYEFNAFFALAHNYTAFLNSFSNFDSLYTSLSSTQVADLYTMKQILDRAEEYCNECLPLIRLNTNCGCS